MFDSSCCSCARDVLTTASLIMRVLCGHECRRCILLLLMSLPVVVDDANSACCCSRLKLPRFNAAGKIELRAANRAVGAALSLGC